MRRAWAWVRRERFSWLDLICILLIGAAFQVTQDAASWPWWLADAVVLGGILVAVFVIAFIHGIWEGIRGQAD